MIHYKTAEEVERIRTSCLLVSKTLAEVGKVIRPGMTGAEIDRLAETFIRDHGAVPAFKGYRGFPATLCVSVNEQVVHGIPTPGQVFADGDIVSVDCGVLLDGFYGDAAYTFPLGNVKPEVMALCRATKASLHRGIEQALPGHRLGDISFAIQHYIEKEMGYSIVRELVGHGIGAHLHEEPEVPNFGKRGRGIKLQEGLVIAIEPMVNLKRRDVRTGHDGWTVFSKDGAPSAHYEHTICIRQDAPDILSDHRLVEEAMRQNEEVQAVDLPTVGA